MKIRILITFIAFAFAFSSQAQNFGLEPKNDKKASIEWIKTEHDLGEIPQNKPITVKFKFKNTGMVPVIITNVESSCGCTVPEYPKAPIKYGASAEITATFDAKNLGAFYKTIKVHTNSTKKIEELQLRGVVVK